NGKRPLSIPMSLIGPRREEPATPYSFLLQCSTRASRRFHTRDDSIVEFLCQGLGCRIVPRGRVPLVAHVAVKADEYSTPLRQVSERVSNHRVACGHVSVREPARSAAHTLDYYPVSIA